MVGSWFREHRGRKNERCASCRSVARRKLSGGRFRHAPISIAGRASPVRRSMPSGWCFFRQGSVPGLIHAHVLEHHPAAGVACFASVSEEPSDMIGSLDLSSRPSRVGTKRRYSAYATRILLEAVRTASACACRGWERHDALASWCSATPSRGSARSYDRLRPASRRRARLSPASPRNMLAVTGDNVVPLRPATA